MQVQIAPLRPLQMIIKDEARTTVWCTDMDFRRSSPPTSQEQRQSLQDELRQASRDVRIYTTACDISNRSVVEEAVTRLRQDGLPPVKGIIQSAAVLQVSPPNLTDNVVCVISSHPVRL